MQAEDVAEGKAPGEEGGSWAYTRNRRKMGMVGEEMGRGWRRGCRGKSRGLMGRVWILFKVTGKPLDISSRRMPGPDFSFAFEITLGAVWRRYGTREEAERYGDR